jgi:hypothetical protein
MTESPVQQAEPTCQCPDTDEDRYHAALHAIVELLRLDDWRPDRDRNEWGTGYHCGLIAGAQIARRALDPAADAEADERMRWTNSATDEEYYAKTGYCGACGIIGDTCQCEPGTCGCWTDHGPPKAPWVPAEKQLAVVEERLAAVLAECAAAETAGLAGPSVPGWVRIVRQAATGVQHEPTLFEQVPA